MRAVAWSPSAESLAQFDEYDEIIWLGLTYFVAVLPFISFVTENNPVSRWCCVAVWVAGLWVAKTLDYGRSLIR